MNSKLKKALIIIVIVIAVIALGIGLFLFLLIKGFEEVEFNMTIPEEPVRDFINDSFSALFHIGG